MISCFNSQRRNLKFGNRNLRHPIPLLWVHASDLMLLQQTALLCLAAYFVQKRLDNYVDDTVLTMLDKRGENVSATIYTKAVSAQLELDLAKHNAQYRPIEIKAFDRVHDRFLCIDSTVYHIGASLKDLGKKWFAFSRMEMKAEELFSSVDTK